MKLCEDCKHMRPGGLFCVAPENGISPVDGKPKPLFACVQRLDGRSGLAGDLRCGPEAKHFQQKPPERQKRAWWKFWKDTNAAPSNVEVTGLGAASLPQGPCGLPGSTPEANGEKT